MSSAGGREGGSFGEGGGPCSLQVIAMSTAARRGRARAQAATAYQAFVRSVPAAPGSLAAVVPGERVGLWAEGLAAGLRRDDTAWEAVQTMARKGGAR